jgi:hypothetical protein
MKKVKNATICIVREEFCTVCKCSAYMIYVAFDYKSGLFDKDKFMRIAQYNEKYYKGFIEALNRLGIEVGIMRDDLNI